MKQLLAFSLVLLLSQSIYCQDIDNEERIYDFLNNVILFNHKEGIIISMNGSTRPLLTKNDSIDFDPYHCLFIEEKYRTENFWKLLLKNDEYNYLVDQSKKLRSFKWNKEKLPQDVDLYSTRQIKSYSRRISRWFNEDSKVDRIKSANEIKIINTYSAPIFNKNGDVAVIFIAQYSGPLSGFWYIELYSKKDGKWKKIGTDIKGMS